MAEEAIEINEVDVPGLSRLISDREALVIDVRESDEAESDGVIEGADVIPMGTVDEASKSWDKEEPVITICRSGRRSGRVALELEKLGFKRIASMRGGMVAWQSQ